MQVIILSSFVSSADLLAWIKYLYVWEWLGWLLLDARLEELRDRFELICIVWIHFYTFT